MLSAEPSLNKMEHVVGGAAMAGLPVSRRAIAPQAAAAPIVPDFNMFINVHTLLKDLAGPAGRPSAVQAGLQTTLAASRALQRRSTTEAAGGPNLDENGAFV